MNSRIIAAILSLCFLLSACAAAGSSETPEALLFTVPYVSASRNEYGQLRTDYPDPGEFAVKWTPVSGYSAVDAGETTDAYSPGVCSSDGDIVLDYIHVVRTDGTNLIDYANLTENQSLFSQVIESGRRRAYICAFINGGDWVNKNSTSTVTAVTGYYGYLVSCEAKLTNDLFLGFNYYFKAADRIDSYADVPDDIKAELSALIDSFDAADDGAAQGAADPETVSESAPTEKQLCALCPVTGSEENLTMAVTLTCPCEWENYGSDSTVDIDGKKLLEIDCRSTERAESLIDGAEERQIGDRTFWVRNEEYYILEKTDWVPYVIRRYYCLTDDVCCELAFFQNQDEPQLSVEEFEQILTTVEISAAE